MTAWKAIFLPGVPDDRCVLYGAGSFRVCCPNRDTARMIHAVLTRGLTLECGSPSCRFFSGTLKEQMTKAAARAAALQIWRLNSLLSPMVRIIRIEVLGPCEFRASSFELPPLQFGQQTR